MGINGVAHLTPNINLFQVIITKYICNNLTLVCMLQDTCLNDLGLIQFNIG